jgi:hypothetical protein
VMDSGGEEDCSDSELSDTDRNFLTKGAFLLTPSNELTLEKAEAIVEKMNFRAPFSLTKTATGILFKFAEPDDCAAVYKKGFHKVSSESEPTERKRLSACYTHLSLLALCFRLLECVCVRKRTASNSAKSKALFISVRAARALLSLEGD